MRKTVDEEYLNLLQDIKDNGHVKGDRTGTGTKSVFGRQIRMHMADGFPLLTTKKIHTKSVLGELLWFIEGNTNAKYLKEKYGCSIWDEWAAEDGELGPVYGKQWVNWGGYYSRKHEQRSGEKGVHFQGINQLEVALKRLQEKPDCRRIMVSAWKVDEIEQMALPPCHYGFQMWSRELTLEERAEYYLKTHISELNDGVLNYDWISKNLCSHDDYDKWHIPKRELSLMWNQRSVDTLLGLPFNIASYAFLLHMFAQQANMVAGELIGNLGDTHLYNNHMTYVDEQLLRDPKKFQLPQLKLNKANSLFDYKPEDFEIIGYESYPNWKNVPIAV